MPNGDKKMEVSITTTFKLLIKRWPYLVAAWAVAFGAVYYFVPKNKPYLRAQVQAYPFSSAELREGRWPETYGGAQLLVKFTETLNTYAFREGFYQENRDLVSSAFETPLAPESIPAYARFSNNLAVKQMTEEYTVINFSAEKADEAAAVLKLFVTSANHTAFEALQKDHVEKIEVVKRRIEANRAFFTASHAEAAEAASADIIHTAKKLGLPQSMTAQALTSTAFAPIAWYMQQQLGEYHTLKRLESEIPKSGVAVRVAEVSSNAVAPFRFTLMLAYALLGGFIAGAFAALTHEAVSAGHLSFKRLIPQRA